MYYDPDNSIPRVHVIRENNQILCVLDDKFKQRFGPVLLWNNKQGMHLFSISYCIASMAARYSNMSDSEIVKDITSRFHCNFLTILTLGSKFLGTDTHFLKNWEMNFDNLTEQYEELKSYHTGKLEEDVLEHYLNIVGAMLHTLPCNVAFSKNSSDPKGGGQASTALMRINAITEGDSSFAEVNQNIALTIDRNLVQKIFEKGFDENNELVLAFMIMQIRELQSLRAIRQNNSQKRQSELALEWDAKKIASDLFEIAFKSDENSKIGDTFSDAVKKAVMLITSIQNSLKWELDKGQHKVIKNILDFGLVAVENKKIEIVDDPNYVPVGENWTF